MIKFQAKGQNLHLNPNLIRFDQTLPNFLLQQKFMTIDTFLSRLIYLSWPAQLIHDRLTTVILLSINLLNFFIFCQMVKNIIIPLAFFLLYLLTQSMSTIFKPTTVFYSQLCSLGQVNAAPSTIVTCTTEIVQQNIIRTGIALAEFTKPANQYFSFNASVTAGGTTTSSFSITIQMAMPWSGMKLGYFLLVIKAQTTVQMIDLIHWGWGPGTVVDTDQNLNRTIYQTSDLTTLTIFTSGTGLTLRPLITSLHMTPRLQGDGSFSLATDTQFTLLASNSGNTINVTLDVLDETRISFIRGIVLLYNTATITAEATAKSWDMLLTQVTFNDPANYAFSTNFIAYGPRYNGKCLLGYNKIFVEGFHNIDFNFANTALGNFSILNFNTNSPTKQYGIVLCFGNDSTMCGQNLIWLDSLNGLCYLSTTCPLPVFALWTQVNLCPICTQLICSNCTITNRSNCLTCGLYSTLTSGKCVCNAGYWPLMTAISTSSLGMWDGVANSQTECRYNCTAQIPGCTFDKCNSSTYCTECLSGFTFGTISGASRGCKACPGEMINCVTCSSLTVCTLCDPNYFINGNNKCQLCSSIITGCLTCDPWWPCLTCGTGWILEQGGCKCDPGTNGLQYCTTCSNPTTCTACDSNLYFLQSSDNKCYPCSAFDANCLQCSAENVCTLCAATYGIKTFTNATTLCVLCSTIANCEECTVIPVCTECVTTYYLASGGVCQLCNVPIEGCSTCAVASTCITCEVGWLLDAALCMCDPDTSNLLNCQTCSTPTVCTACDSNLYYLSPSDFLCYLCSNFDANCVQCDALDTCTICVTTHGIQANADTTTTCVLCSVAIDNCVECFLWTACTLCDTNYYIKAANLCELCSIPIPGCLTCTDGVTCTSCGVGWTLTGAQCVCNPNTSNLLHCQTCLNPTTCTSCVSNLFYLYSLDTLCYICSTFDYNCVECSDFEVCTLCATTWGVQNNVNGSALCVMCSTVILNCVQCLVSTTCTLCDTNYFITNAGDCQLCNVPVPGCLTCNPTPLGVACNTCDLGWELKWFRCVCDPIASNLLNCETCASPIVCTKCVSSMFYIDPVDFKCYPCTTFDPNCVQCGSLNRCSLCATTYGIQTKADGTTLCVPCKSTLSYCTECLVVSACTNCDLGFGLNLALTCSTCVSMFKGCVECETSVECLMCTSDAFLIMGRCRYCWELFKCASCVSNATSIVCVSCETGYYLIADPVTGVMQCRICKELTLHCEVCSSSQCLTCEYPYLLGAEKTCNMCSPGFQSNNGFCTNITGCQSIILNSAGQQVCIACMQSSHFLMDERTRKCMCAVGYKQVYDPAVVMLAQCLPICGDGIVLLEYETCDDNNTVQGDGCNANCQTEKDFDCGVMQPSVCVLNANIDSIEFTHVSRELGKNQAVMSFTIFPRHEGLTKMKWEKLVKFNFSISTVDPARLTFNYQPLTGELTVTVPYSQELEESHLESVFTLDPKYIISQPASFLLTHRLKGVNAPLIFEEQAELATQKNINLITLLLTILLLLQFYVGSYFHKMIGLETIQVIQSIYFVRMAAASSSTSLMNSINSIQYSAGGYHNSQIFYGDTTNVELSLFSSTGDEFLMIDLKRYFLLNANLCLFPIIIAVGVYAVSLLRKYKARNQYVASKQQQLKDKYTSFRRSSQWVYDHFVFPSIMMFSLISYFQTILLLSSPSNLTGEFSHIQNPSFAVHITLTLLTIGIYCNELFESIGAYSKYCMTESQKQKAPKSMVEKLQHDENNIDRANYHPAYPLCYLLYYFVLSLTMVGTVLLPQFQYALQVNMGVSFVYFLVIIVWRPYARAVNAHNHFLKLYYGAFVLFLGFCYMFSRMQALGSSTYITIMYLVTAFIGLIMAGGFIRVYIEVRFRKALDLDNTLMWDLEGKKTLKKKTQNEEKAVLVSKKSALLMNNQYTFENQLKQYQKRLMTPNSIMNSNLLKTLSVTDSKRKDYLISKIRQEIYKQKQTILLEGIDHHGFTNEMRRVNYKTQEDEQDDLINESNFADHLLETNQLGDSLLNKKPEQEVPSGRSAKSLKEDIKANLRKQWILKNYE